VTRACGAVAATLAVGFAAYAGLHILEPRLTLTWSYAHLHRRPWLPRIAVALLLAGPPLAALAWRQPTRAAPLRRFTPLQVAGLVALAVVVDAVVGLRFPAWPISIDPWQLLKNVAQASNTNARWHLTLATYDLLSRWFLGRLGPATIIRSFSSVTSAIGLVALTGSARRLATTRGEAVAIALLVWTAFGTIQLAIGYLDVYPVALAVTGLFVWTALGTLQGDVHPLWPLTIAALGPFWYEGLVLLGPATVVVGIVALRRPGGVRRVAVGLATALFVAGLATVPRFGRPFAWLTFLDAVESASDAALGLSPTSVMLPGWAMFSGWHARDVAHTIVLVDFVGVLLTVVAGTWCVVTGPWRRSWDATVVFLVALVVPQLLFLFVMDPLWGAFADWDLFCWGAATTSLLGAYAFVLWGRECPRLFPLVLGLAIAAAGVHLLARLNALEVDLKAHLVESPYHVQF
jgi:hypothetical protein